jgi:hypothetical protein
VNVAVVDTNVILVANGQHEKVSSKCIETCALELQNIMRQGKLTLDDQFRILKEYLHKTEPKKGNGPGNAFVKWALNNRCNSKHVILVQLWDHATRGFESFPNDADLEHFDESDRKFVAVAGAHTAKPPILQAADSKWLDWSPALQRHGIVVKFLCQSDIACFHKKKFGA